jgi:hypothetical protein
VIIQPTQTVNQSVASNEWLASRHGTDAVDTITLDLTTFTAGTHYVASATTGKNPFIPAGTPVKKNGAVYNPSANVDTTADGYLYKDVEFVTGQTKAGAALLWHGEVVTAKLNNAFAPNAKPATVRHI